MVETLKSWELSEKWLWNIPFFFYNHSSKIETPFFSTFFQKYAIFYQKLMQNYFN